jgi:ABC-2 type transport system permease protein
MNTPSNVPPGTSVVSRVAERLKRPANDLMYWSVRRELWENRSIYIAPLAVAAVLLFAFTLSLMTRGHGMRALSRLDAAKQQAAIGQPYMIAALLIMTTAFIVAVFYCLDALHGERRDRSILFWKSLPVSDLTTVVSKASIPIVVVPLLAFAITVVTQWIMLLLSSVAALGSGLSVATLWAHVSLPQMWLMLLYHLLAIHGLWYAPIFGWLLLVSAWARRAAFLWAALPLLAIGVVEKILFNTTHFAAMVSQRISGGPMSLPSMTGGMSMDLLMSQTPGQLLSSPGLWIGLILAAAFLAAAVQLRRYREPI